MWIICVVTALPECGAVAHLVSEVALSVITLYNCIRGSTIICAPARGVSSGQGIGMALEFPSGGEMGPGFPHGTSPWAEGPRESERKFGDLHVPQLATSLPARPA